MIDGIPAPGPSIFTKRTLLLTMLVSYRFLDVFLGKLRYFRNHSSETFLMFLLNNGADLFNNHGDCCICKVCFFLSLVRMVIRPRVR